MHGEEPEDPGGETRDSNDRESGGQRARLAATRRSPPRSSGGSSTSGSDEDRDQLGAGRDFGGYRLVRELGRGGFAEVWEAERASDGITVALKIASSEVTASGEDLGRFQREGRLAASISHARCVYVYGAEQVDGRPTIAMELIPGGSLQDRLDDGGPLPVVEATDALLDILEGLEAAHAAGVVHRDVKPSNCYLDGKGGVRVGDFGISRGLEVAAGLTATGAFVGTPAYSSPEQLRGETVDFRSDFYLLGATYHALLAGRPPFESRGGTQLVASILTDPAPMVTTPEGPIPQALQAVVTRMLAKEPGKRHQSHADLRSDLLPFSSRPPTVTPVDLTRRFLASLVDGVIYGGPFMAYSLVSDGTMSPPVLGLASLLSRAAGVFYYGLCEWRWGRTPGKRALDLCVKRRDGGSISASQAFARTLVLSALALGGEVLIFSGDLAESTALSIALPLLGLAAILAPLVPLLNRRGAMLHDLLTGTRVVRDSPVVRPAEDAASYPRHPIPEGADLGRRGPFRLVQLAWRDGDRALFLAVDDALDRVLWVAERGEGSEPGPRLSGDRLRRGQVRWVQAGVDDGGQWEAWEQPPGHHVAGLLQASGPLAWSRLKPLLRQLSVEVAALARDGWPEGGLSLRHVWVTANGHVRVLPFPLLAPNAADLAAPVDAQRLVRQFAICCLRGHEVSLEEAATSTTGRPMPEHARRFIENLGDVPGDLEIAAFQALHETRKERLTWHDRSDAGMAFMVTFIGLAVFVPILVLSMPARPDGPVSTSFFAACLVAVWMLGLPALPVSLWAGLARRGEFMRNSRLSVQTTRGRPASRLRCWWRSFLAWSPSAACVVALSIAHRASELAWPWFDTQSPLIFLPVAAALVHVAGFAMVLRWPERGLNDRLAGTHVVPD